jgi:opacity protein-like surface antigen
MYKKTLLALGLATLSMGAFASNSTFEGPYVGASVNKVDLSADVRSNAASIDFSNEGRNLGLGFNLGYGVLNNNFYCAVEAGIRSGSGEAEGEYSGVVVKIEGEQSWDVSLLPGFKVNDSTLIYGRIGMGSMSGKAVIPGTTYSSTEDLDTMIWGLGLQALYSEALSGRLEVSKTSFDKKFESERWVGEATALSIGIQYGF